MKNLDNIILILNNNFNGSYNSNQYFYSEICRALKILGIKYISVSNVDDAVHVFENKNVSFSVCLGRYEYFIDSVLYEYDENDHQYKRAMDQLKSFLDYMPRWQMKGQARKKTESGLSLKKESTIVNATSSDYVTMPVILKKAPGRNDLCPCGSGKKYKKCCGREN